MTPRAGDSVRIAVTVAPGETEIRELPAPASRPTTGLLLIEAAGVCGSDAHQYRENLPARVMGHENVGRLVGVGELAAERWGFAEGDRVLLEEYLPCGYCDFCRAGEYRSCLASDTSVNKDAVRFGSTPLTVAPGLWGGYGELMYLPPNAVMHGVPENVPSVLATLGLPLGNGYQWVCLDGRVLPGETVVVLGPGQAGIASVVAAKLAGANALVVGHDRDRERLDVAARLGADLTFVTGPGGECAEADVVSAVQDLTSGRGAAMVVDVAAGNDETVGLAVQLLAKRGRLMMAAASRTPLTAFPVWALSRKQITLHAVRGHSFASVEWALRLLGSSTLPLDAMSSFVGGLDDLDHALRATAGEGSDPILHATITPR